MAATMADRLARARDAVVGYRGTDPRAVVEASARGARPVLRTRSPDVRWAGTVAGIVLTFTSAPACPAQTAATSNPQSVFDPSPMPALTSPGDEDPVAPEDLPVKKRRHTDESAVGLRSGAWLFSPRLTAGVLYDSNVFSSNAIRRADLAAATEVGGSATALWERHALAFEAGARTFKYRQNSGLDRVDASLKGTGRFDVTRDLAVLASFQVARLTEGVGTVTSPIGAARPVPYVYLLGDITVRRRFNRLTGSVGLRTESFDYGDTRSLDGIEIDQSARDGRIHTLHGRIDYAFSPAFGLFAAAETNQRRIRGSAIQPLDSSGYRVLSGVTAELTRLLTGEIGIGYLRQDFESSAVPPIEGPAVRALVTWRPTRLVDVTLRAEQRVSQTADTATSGVLANVAQVIVDYEARRDVVISFSGGYERDRFDAQARRDDVYTLGAGVKYVLNEMVSITLDHVYTRRDSNIPAAEYGKHQVLFNVAARF